MDCPIEPRQDIVENSGKASIADIVLSIHEATGGHLCGSNSRQDTHYLSIYGSCRAEKTLVGGATSKIDFVEPASIFDLSISV